MYEALHSYSKIPEKLGDTQRQASLSAKEGGRGQHPEWQRGDLYESAYANCTAEVAQN